MWPRSSVLTLRDTCDGDSLLIEGEYRPVQVSSSPEVIPPGPARHGRTGSRGPTSWLIFGALPAFRDPRCSSWSWAWSDAPAWKWRPRSPAVGTVWAFFTDGEVVLGPRALVYTRSQVACEEERLRRALLVLPVLPAASRTLVPSVCVPFLASWLFTVNHGMVTGPRDEVVSERTTFPSTLSVKTLDDPPVPSTHMTTHTVPLTVEPALGCVMTTLRSRDGGGGGGGEVCRMATAMTSSLDRVPCGVRIGVLEPAPRKQWP
jgi:hypothetical protein